MPTRLPGTSQLARPRLHRFLCRFPCRGTRTPTTARHLASRAHPLRIARAPICSHARASLAHRPRAGLLTCAHLHPESKKAGDRPCEEGEPPQSGMPRRLPPTRRTKVDDQTHQRSEGAARQAKPRGRFGWPDCGESAAQAMADPLGRARASRFIAASSRRRLASPLQWMHSRRRATSSGRSRAALPPPRLRPRGSAGPPADVTQCSQGAPAATPPPPRRRPAASRRTAHRRRAAGSRAPRRRGGGPPPPDRGRAVATDRRPGPRADRGAAGTRDACATAAARARPQTA